MKLNMDKVVELNVRDNSKYEQVLIERLIKIEK